MKRLDVKRLEARSSASFIKNSYIVITVVVGAIVYVCFWCLQAFSVVMHLKAEVVKARRLHPFAFVPQQLISNGGAIVKQQHALSIPLYLHADPTIIYITAVMDDPASSFLAAKVLDKRACNGSQMVTSTVSTKVRSNVLGYTT
jgi:hypothetical protein